MVYDMLKKMAPGGKGEWVGVTLAVWVITRDNHDY